MFNLNLLNPEWWRVSGNCPEQWGHSRTIGACPYWNVIYIIGFVYIYKSTSPFPRLKYLIIGYFPYCDAQCLNIICNTNDEHGGYLQYRVLQRMCWVCKSAFNRKSHSFIHHLDLPKPQVQGWCLLLLQSVFWRRPRPPNCHDKNCGRQAHQE